MRAAVEVTANHDQGTVTVQGLMRPAVEATANHLRRKEDGNNKTCDPMQIESNNP